MGRGGTLVLYLSNCGYALSLPFNLLQHLSDSKANFPALVANSVVPLATPCALYVLPIAGSHKGLFYYMIP